jgi:tetratricopeptide (TPR) repeat protein
MFVGRQSEIASLDLILDSAASGHGAFRVLTGEAGIGKTRLADEIVDHATARGFLASWGRAWETGGAPAYWPWVELLGTLVDAASEVPPRVAELLGRSTAAILGDGTRADPARERFELFEGVSTFMRGCARKKPLLIVFDDLHLADAASLDLLSFVARGLRASRIVVLGTYRDVEARRPTVADLLARVSREGEVLALPPLSREEVAEVVRHEVKQCDATLSTAIHDLTEGNPLFLRETIHAINADKAGAPLDALRNITAPGGVLALVRGRLAGASEETRTLLEIAATLGRESKLALIAAAAGKTPRDAIHGLEDATRRGILVRRSEDRWAFSHGLVREAIYADIDAERRRALHRAIAVALDERVQRTGDDGERSSADETILAMLAHHAIAALPMGDPVAAVRIACRAAVHARRQLAYEDALALLQRAVATCDEYRIDDRERIEVALALGWATTEAGQLARGREIFREAAVLARRIDHPALLARAALGQGGEYVLGESRAELVDVLREALRELGDPAGDRQNLRLRARLLARLAAALTPSGDPDERLGLAREALAMAEGETDARTRIDVDIGVGAALTDFAPSAERVSVNERLLREARRVSDRVLELRALTRLACDHLEHGDLARSEVAIAARAKLAESMGHPRYRWQTPLLRSMSAMPQGRFDECEANILETRALAAQSPDPNAERCIEFHRFAMLLVAGRSEDLWMQEAIAQRTLVSLLGNHHLRTWLSAIAAAKAGDKVRATHALHGVGIARNATRLVRVTFLEAAVLAGFREMYEPLYRSLEASEDANTCWGPFAFACTPPIARTLAMAAFALGQSGDALLHCERALALANRMGADAHRAWVHLAWGEGVGASGHLERALELAEKLSMPEVAQRARVAIEVASKGEASPSARPASASDIITPFTLLREPDGRAWIVERRGRSFRLKDVRGLEMLSRLISHPGREMHSLELASERDGDAVGGVVDLGDAGAVIDVRAREAYKARIAELRDDLAEAEHCDDGPRATHIREELDALTSQIAAAFGLGGRERRLGSAAERARVTVQRRIRDAIKKIAAHDAALGRHLDAAIRTGTFCVYEPESRKA